jgi:hypothetical protein
MPEDQTLSQPPGYMAEGKEDIVWKLGKALYNNLVTSGIRNLRAFLSLLVSMLVSLTLVFSFGPHPL